ncbi:MAG TPA: winged helix-turn-helix domain-containing protein [Candidatus Bathyarchaeia archaeon]|nr:winged helix-turn-helix domain-containing protein [Candidatus Bathyarchaeia archaeon]
MEPQKQYYYPLPKEAVENCAKNIFGPILTGECVTSVWVGSAGRRTVIKFIIENIGLFKEIIPDYQKYLLVYIEPLDLLEESLAAYLRLVGQSVITACEMKKNCLGSFDKKQFKIFNNENASYPQLLAVLKLLIGNITGHELKVVIFLGEIDELLFVNSVFCNNLRSLWNSFSGKLHYVFLIKEIKMIFDKDRVGEELGELFLQNVVYEPISRQNADYVIDRMSYRFGYSPSQEEKKVAKEMCGGHPYFLKVTCKLLSKKNGTKSLSTQELIDLLRRNYEIRSVAQRMIDVQTDKAKENLKNITEEKIATLEGEQVKVLEWLGLIEKDQDGYYQPFCLLFQDAISKRIIEKTKGTNQIGELSYDAKSGALSFRGQSIEEKFSCQEYEVLIFLLKERNKLCSRDEISKVLWGKDSYEKYSDWAIDQLMSKLRKKIAALRVKNGRLITVRGRGYKFAID